MNSNWFIYSGSQYLFMKKVCKENNVPNPYNGKAVWGIAGVFILLAILSEVLFLTRLIRYTVIAISFLVTAAFLLNDCTVEKEIKVVFNSKEQADGFRGMCFSWK